MLAQPRASSPVTLDQSASKAFRKEDFVSPYKASYTDLFHKLEVFQWLKSQQTDLDSELFRAALSILSPFGEDGRKFLHMWLKNQPCYSADEINAKFQHEFGM